MQSRSIDERTFYDERPGVPNIWLLTDDEETNIINANGGEKYVLDTYGEKVTEIGIYNLYAYMENPFTLNNVGLPPEKQQHKSDCPDAYGMVHPTGVVENHELVTDGAVEGYILYGPYTPSVPGTYDITLHYELLSDAGAGPGSFDVTLDALPVAASAFAGGDDSVTLEDVAIEAGHSFEVRVWTPVGMAVRIRSIEYERVA